MRVAALYDIHSNLPALEAVIQDVRREQVDLLVIGGDVVPGSMPRETLDYLFNLDIPKQFIHGNGEDAVLADIAGIETGTVPAQFRSALHWVAQQIQPDSVAWLASWPLTLQLEIAGLGKVLFCHATPRSDDEIFTKLTSDSLLAPIFDGLDVAVVVCGHTHMQFDRRARNVRIVNAGSVGAPYGKATACWLLLGLDVQLRHTAYDLEKAAGRIRNTGYPLAQSDARNILTPPPESEMLEILSRAELK